MTGGYYKNYMKRYILVLVLLISCARIPMGYPTKNNLVNNPPPGPPAFQYGWVDGCDTGVSGWVAEFYKSTSLSRVRKDFQFAEEHPDYETAWQIAFWYCMRIAERHDGRKRDKYAGL